MRRIAIAMTALLLTVMVLVPTAGSASPEPERLPIDDTREVQMPKDARLVKHAPGLAREVERLQGRSVGAAAVGDTKFWLGYDFFNDVVYVKEYTLRGVGAHAELWVASDSDSTSTALEFPAGVPAHTLHARSPRFSREHWCISGSSSFRSRKTRRRSR